jgi:hypothetical protein
MNISESTDRCPYAEPLVAYIYGEMTPHERRSLEDHFVDCQLCTDEFAAVAFARYSVFEYQQVEFAPLETPQISIPYPSPASRPASPAFGSALAALLSGWRTAFAAAAVVVIAVAGIMWRSASEKPAEPIAASVQPVENKEMPEADPPEVVSGPAVQNRPSVEKGILTAKRAVDKRPVTKPRTIKAQPDASGTYALHPQTPLPDRRPVLTNYDESDDSSLRLSDLFDNEVGMK